MVIERFPPLYHGPRGATMRPGSRASVRPQRADAVVSPATVSWELVGRLEWGTRTRGEARRR
eukprot:scaffold101836_cov39-Tisochrysis_lutea.AAC.1